VHAQNSTDMSGLLLAELHLWYLELRSNYSVNKL